MCTIIAIKLPRHPKTGKPLKHAKYYLAKFRDRYYDPEYILRYTSSKRNTGYFLVDQLTDWTEFMILNRTTKIPIFWCVNSALSNHSDKLDGVKCSNNYGKSFRSLLKCNNLDKITEQVIESKIDGCTFVSNGDETNLIELSISNDYYKQFANEQDVIIDTATLPLEHFEKSVTKVDDIAVMTNHGINIKAGYEPTDGISYLSSVVRRDDTYKYLESHVFTEEDLMHLMKYGYNKKYRSSNKNFHPYLFPYRYKSDIINYNKTLKGQDIEKLPMIYTTTTIVNSIRGMSIRLIDANIKFASFNLLKNNNVSLIY